MTDATLAAIAATLDEIEGLAARFDRLGLAGIARKLRAGRERIEETLTAPPEDAT